jgi:hypothetical protein
MFSSFASDSTKEKGLSPWFDVRRFFPLRDMSGLSSVEPSQLPFDNPLAESCRYWIRSEFLYISYKVFFNLCLTKKKLHHESSEVQV